MDQAVVLARESRKFTEVLAVDGERRMRHERERHKGSADICQHLRPPVSQGHAVGPRESIGAGEGEEHGANDVPEADLDAAAMRGLRVQVHVQRRRCSAQQALEGTQPRSDVRTLGIHHARLFGPHTLEESLQVDFLGHAAQQRHGQVGVQVDQARHQETPAQVDYFARLDIEVGAYGNDAAALDRDVSMLERRAVTDHDVIGVAQQQIDVHAANIRAAQSSIEVTRAAPSRMTAMISSMLIGSSLKPAAGLATRHIDA